jgi:hypothetical protein
MRGVCERMTTTLHLGDCLEETQYPERLRKQD